MQYNVVKSWVGSTHLRDPGIPGGGGGGGGAPGIGGGGGGPPPVPAVFGLP